MPKRIKPKEAVSPTFFLQVMNHWSTPGIAGAVVALSLLVLCSGPWGITLGVGALFTGAMFSAARLFTPDPVKNKNVKQLTFPAPVSYGYAAHDFLSLIYGVTESNFKHVHLPQNPSDNSPIIAVLNEVMDKGYWGAELHAFYLGEVFGVPLKGMNYSKNEAYSRPLYELSSSHYEAITLINKQRGHWTTKMGQEEWDNPGGGDCLFYAISLGLVRLIQQEGSNSFLLKKWQELDPELGLQAQMLEIFVTEKNPKQNKEACVLWERLQMSLRKIVAKHMVTRVMQEAETAISNDTSDSKNAAGYLQEHSHIFREFSSRGSVGAENLFHGFDRKASGFKLDSASLSVLVSGSVEAKP